MTNHRKAQVPSHRLHRSSGQAVVTLNGRDHYLGKHGSDESGARYERLVGTYLLNGGSVPDPDSLAEGCSVAKLCDGFLDYAERTYLRPDGTPSREVKNVQLALRPLLQLYFDADAGDFGPQALMVYREALIDSGLSRKVVNQRVNTVRRAFKWAASQEWIPATTYQRLTTVEGLKQGRSRAPETRPVECVPVDHIERAMPFMPPPAGAMVELQLLTAARPGEITVLRVCDIDRSEAVWLFRPIMHKNQWRGQDRVIPIGPKGQSIILGFLNPGLQDTFLFSPKRAEAERLAILREGRETPLWPSHLARQTKRRGSRPRRVLRDGYDTSTYAQAIRRACKRAGVPVWSPGRLRHNAATRLHRDLGIDAASAALGHRLLETTQRYSEARKQLAIEAAARFG